MGRALLIFMLLAGFFGAMADHGPRGPKAGDPAEHLASSTILVDTAARPAASEGAAQSSDGSSVTLERSGDGHFYADVEVNGAPVHMLVDTGASGVALSREAARSAGIATSIGMNEVIGQGADGAIHGEPVRIDRMRLGPASGEGINAVVLNSGEISLLGQDFLKRFASLEIRDDRMVLR